MTKRAGVKFTQWADTVLAGTGWAAATARHAAARPREDLATAALADGFAAAAHALAAGRADEGGGS